MNVIPLSVADLCVAAGLVLLLALLSVPLKLGLTRQLSVASLRATVQLLLIGLVLKVVFDQRQPLLIAMIVAVMVLVGGYEVTARQKRRFAGWWAFAMGSTSMFVSSFVATVLALTLVLEVQPWYEPRYLIPLLGMLLGNTLNGVALCLDRLTQTAWQQRAVIEARLMLGHSWSQAVGDLRRDCMRSGMIPSLNALSAAGVVALPGMMTGQILAGSPPLEAAKYQLLILFFIVGGTGLGTASALWWASRRLFDERQRLRLDRLRGAPGP